MWEGPPWLAVVERRRQCSENIFSVAALRRLAHSSIVGTQLVSPTCIVTQARNNKAMLRNIPSATLKELVRLSERKESLMAQIQEIDRQMLRVQKKFGIPQRESDKPEAARSSSSRRRKR